MKPTYWTSVVKRLILFIFILIITICVFKITIFYMPFLIAFILSCIMEPFIKKLMTNFKISRRISSIIVFTITFGTIFGLVIWGIVTLISESTNLLSSLNDYYNSAYSRNSKYNFFN